MVLALIVGDLHIPYRATDIPEVFKKMLMPGRINTIFITGNITSPDMLAYFRSLSSNVVFTKGDFDDATEGPEFAVTTVGDSVKVGMLHGHQVVPWGDKESLAMWQRKLDVDVLVSGHTHAQKYFEFDGKLFVNPGSITGAHSAFDADVTPAFVLMDIQGTSITTYLYTCEEGNLKVKRKTFVKA
jgi:vacuolar protein sorting-associated protein 29